MSTGVPALPEPQCEGLVRLAVRVYTERQLVPMMQRPLLALSDVVFIYEAAVWAQLLQVVPEGQLNN